jgi:Cu-Zn family superoxide dismutase
MKQAIALWPSPFAISDSTSFSGFVRFSPIGTNEKGNLNRGTKRDTKNTRNGVLVEVNLVGLEPFKTYAIHIHEKRFESFADLEDGCMSLGGHFNPYGVSHGTLLNGKDAIRHVGDLCNNIHTDSMGHVNFSYIDELVSLSPRAKAYIGNKSVVVHSRSDDLGRQGRVIPRKGFVRYDEMTADEFKKQTGESFTKRHVKDVMDGSLVTGNAGGRMA